MTSVQSVLLSLLHPQKRQAYQEHLQNAGYSPSTIARKTASLNQLDVWAKEKGYLGETLISIPQTPSLAKTLTGKRLFISLAGITGIAAIGAFLIFLNIPGALNLASSARDPKSPKSPTITASAESAPWIVHFEGQVTSARDPALQGKVTQEATGSAQTKSALQTKPLNQPAKFTFKLYSQNSGGTALWTSKDWALSPDSQGNVSVPLGDTTQGDPGIPSQDFFQYKDLFLGVAVNHGPELLDRFRVATATTAANSILLNSSPAKTNAVPNSIPIINNEGALVLAAPAPKIEATNGNFAIEGRAITLQTPFASDGDITLAPDGGGSINLRLSNSDSDSLSLTNANLKTGTLIQGRVSNDAQTYHFLDFESGASSSARFSVAATGDVYFTGGLRDDTLASFIPLSDTSNTSLPGNATSILGALNLAYSTALDAGGQPAPAPAATPTPTPVGSSAPNLFTDGGTYLYPTGRESIRIYDSVGTNYIDISDDGSNVILDTNSGEFQFKDKVSIQASLNVGDIGALSAITGSGDLTLTMSGGDVILSNGVTVNIGGSGSDVAYNVIGDTTSGASSSMDSDDDLYIEGNLEVDGTIIGTINPGFTAGSMVFQGSSGLTEDNTNLFWNDSTDRLGIGDNTPDDRFDVESSTLGYNFLFGSGGITFSTSGTSGITETTFGSYAITDNKGAANAIAITANQGGIDISTGTGTAGQDIDILSGTSINLTAQEAASDAIVLSAPQGGIQLSTGSGSQDIAIKSGDAINLTAGTNGITLSSGTGTTESGLLVDSTGVYVGKFTAANSAALCWDNSGGSYITDCTGGPSADYAEFYPVTPGTDYAEIVVATPKTILVDHVTTDPQGNLLPTTPHYLSILAPATQPYQSSIIGITTANYADFSSTGRNQIKPADNPLPVALSGRVPVKIDPDSPPIEVGDFLTSSTVPGSARKATQAGYVVGKALSSWQPNTAKTHLLVFVNNTYYDPDVALESLEEYTVAKTENSENLSGNLHNTFYVIRNTTGQAVNRLASFSQSVIANLRAGSIDTDLLTANEIAAAKLQVKGTTVTDHLVARSASISGKLTANQLEAKSLVASSSAFSSLITNSLTTNHLIANEATISGQLITNSLITNHLSVSEATASTLSARLAKLQQLESDQAHVKTLQADTIKSSTIDSLTTRVSSLEVTHSAFAPQPVEVRTLDEVGPLNASSSPPVASPSATPNLDGFHNDLAVGSLDTTFLNSDGGFFKEYLGVMGEANINQLNVENTAIIGKSLALTNNSISLLNCPTNTESVTSVSASVKSVLLGCSDTLYIQPTGHGKLSLMANVLVLEQNGNVSLAGNLSVNGNITAKTLSVAEGLSAKYLTLGREATSSATQFGGILNYPLSIFNSSGNLVAAVDASGSAQFAGNLTAKTGSFNNLVIAQGEATPSAGFLSSTLKTNATVGTATLPARQVELKIENLKIGNSSLVYITPTSATQNQVLYIKNKQTCSAFSIQHSALSCTPSFTVALDKPITTNVSFNWWIIN